MARTRTSERERDQTRARILDAAYAVFAERGYRAATVDAIARGAGLSRAGLLHHYASKQGLLLALLDARDEQLDAELHLSRDETTATEILRSMRQSLATILGRRELVKLAHALSAEASDPEHPAHLWLTRRYTRLRATIAETFRVSFAARELVPRVDPDTLAALCLAAIEGLEQQWLADPEAVSVPDGMALLEKLILDALRA